MNPTPERQLEIAKELLSEQEFDAVTKEIGRYDITTLRYGFQAYTSRVIAEATAEKDAEIEALNDMLADARNEMLMVREALGVKYEPHQSVFERTLETCDSLLAGIVPKGEVVVTLTEQGECAAVTRQDEDGRILYMIWEKP